MALRIFLQGAWDGWVIAGTYVGLPAYALAGIVLDVWHGAAGGLGIIIAIPLGLAFAFHIRRLKEAVEVEAGVIRGIIARAEASVADGVWAFTLTPPDMREEKRK